MNWGQCPGHIWEEYESEYTNEYHTQVHCPICRCPGERDEKPAMYIGLQPNQPAATTRKQ